MHPPSPKAMEDRGIINYCRCRSFGATTGEPIKRLVAGCFVASLLCMTSRIFQPCRRILDTLAPRSPRHLRLPIIIAATNAPLDLSTARKRGNTKGESSLEQFRQVAISPVVWQLVAKDLRCHSAKKREDNSKILPH